MAKSPDNLLCRKKHCGGKLILIDGGQSFTRLKCDECTTVYTLNMSMLQFAQFMKNRDKE